MTISTFMFITFYFDDLELDPLAFVLKLDLDMIVSY